MGRCRDHRTGNLAVPSHNRPLFRWALVSLRWLLLQQGELVALADTSARADPHGSLAAAVPHAGLLYAWKGHSTVSEVTKGHSTVSEVTDTLLLHQADAPERRKSRGRTSFSSTAAV